MTKKQERELDALASKLERRLERLYAKQQALGRALAIHPRNIRSLPNVTDLGVGIQLKRGKSSGTIGPVVIVSKKLPAKRLARRSRIPRSLQFRGKVYRIDVIAMRRPVLLCTPGIATTQTGSFNAVPPGVAICAVDQFGKILPKRSGTSGAILKIVMTPPSKARYLLTCDHIVASTQSWAQPWSPTPIHGSFVLKSRGFDASLSEIDKYDVNVHCLGRMGEPIRPQVGMRVMKSGAATGVTGSEIAIVTDSGEPIIDNRALVPFGGVAFVNNGDSGSVAMLGTPEDKTNPVVDPSELGQPIEKEVSDLVKNSTIADAKDRVKQRYRGRAVALIHSLVPPGIPTGTVAYIPATWCRASSMKSILDELRVVIAED
jgi:hypothetical protein